MIGGIVLEVITLEDRIWVNCVDENEKSNEKCAIYVRRNETSERVRPADSIWWQGGKAMWTPYGTDVKAGKCTVDFDIHLTKLGCSGAERPGLVEKIGR